MSYENLTDCCHCYFLPSTVAQLLPLFPFFIRVEHPTIADNSRKYCICGGTQCPHLNFWQPPSQYWADFFCAAVVNRFVHTHTYICMYIYIYIYICVCVCVCGGYVYLLFLLFGFVVFFPTFLVSFFLSSLLHFITPLTWEP